MWVLIPTPGVAGGHPTPVAAVIADCGASVNLVAGILAAIVCRERTGRGQRVDVSLLGGQIWAQASEITYFLLSGRVHGRANRGHPMIRALYGIFPTADGWIALVGVPQQLWPEFCRAIEREDLTDDPRFNTLFQTAENRAELWRICDATFPERTTADWCARLRTHRQRFAPVYDYRDLAADPQPWENGYLAWAEHPEWGRIGVVGSPIRFSETPSTASVLTPEIGQHTEEVLVEAGFTWDELEELRAEGAW
jgi:crotonobetainyl-CoA:carnitine CoA-transferase CaiB-like acyl-CoA transferase